MENLTNITPILGGIITILFGVITAFIIPILRRHYGQEVLDNIANMMYQINYWIGVFVKAAEQIYPLPKSGESKKAYVLEHMKAKLEELGFVVDEDTLDAQIENEVFELNLALKGNKE